MSDAPTTRRTKQIAAHDAYTAQYDDSGKEVVPAIALIPREPGFAFMKTHGRPFPGSFEPAEYLGIASFPTVDAVNVFFKHSKNSWLVARKDYWFVVDRDSPFGQPAVRAE